MAFSRDKRTDKSNDFVVPSIPKIPQGEFLQERLFVLSVLSKAVVGLLVLCIVLVLVVARQEMAHQATPVLVDMSSGKPVVVTAGGTATVGGVEVNEAQVKYFVTRFLESRFNYNYLTFANKASGRSHLRRAARSRCALPAPRP